MMEARDSAECSPVTGRLPWNRFTKSDRDIYAFFTLITGSAFVLMSVVILAVRIRSIIGDSLIAPSTGSEASGLYGIYRVWIGEAVYQPLREHPTVMIFNYLFFYGYGLLGKVFVNEAEALPVFTRFLTLAGVLGSLGVMCRYLWYEARGLAQGHNARIIQGLVLLAPVIAWFGPFMGWWYLTARPDIMAVGFEVTALVLFLRRGDECDSKSIIPITFCFWLAWSMKQTAVFVWLGTLLAIGMKRRWKQVMISVTMFLLLSSLPYLLLGRSYIDHTILAPAVQLWLWEQFLAVGKDALLTGFYVYIPAFILMIYYLTDRIRRDATLNVLVTILVVALIGNLLISGKEGSARNYYFSSFFVAQLFIARFLLSCWQTSKEEKQRTFMKVLLLVFFLGLCLSSLYLIFPNRFGRVELLSPQQREEVLRIRRSIRSAAKPVFVGPSYYALPWNSGQHPSDVLDPISYARARGAGAVVSVEKRIEDGYYAEAFVYEGDWAQVLERSGYKRVSRVGRLIHFVR